MASEKQISILKWPIQNLDLTPIWPVTGQGTNLSCIYGDIHKTIFRRSIRPINSYVQDWHWKIMWVIRTLKDVMMFLIRKPSKDTKNVSS